MARLTQFFFQICLFLTVDQRHNMSVLYSEIPMCFEEEMWNSNVSKVDVFCFSSPDI